MKLRMWLIFSEHFISTGVLFFGILSLLGCGLISDQQNPSVHYVLPDGYVGMFKIILDERDGKDVALRDGRYTYEIPEDGILKIKNFEPLRQMHEETAAFKNGTRIKIPDSTVADNTVALRSAGQHNKGDGPFAIILVLGTKEQTDSVVKEIDKPEFDSLPPRLFNQRFTQP